MDKKIIRSWMLYDWANSAFATTMLAAVLPIFYYDVAAANLTEHSAEVYWGYTQSIAMLLVALLSPLLGAIADMSGLKMFFLRLFSYAGIASSALFFFVGEGDYLLASGLMIIGIIGFSGGNTFYDALLSDLVPYDKRDRISSNGYAFGYIGGGLLLACNLLMIQMPGLFGFPDTIRATQTVFLTVAVWWFVFSLPLFRYVKEQTGQRGLGLRRYASEGFGRVAKTISGLSAYPELLKYMIAFWFFSDGINTIITMASIYGKSIGIGTSDLITALLITQFVGIPCTVLFGRIADKVGSKRALFGSLYVYVGIVILGYFMQSAIHFYLLAILVGVVQGGSQAIARSLFSKLVPIGRSAEYFGFLSVSSKLSAIAGPFVFAFVSQQTGSSQLGILSLLFFFIVGIGMLYTVSLEKGRVQAEKLAAAPK